MPRSDAAPALPPLRSWYKRALALASAGSILLAGHSASAFKPFTYAPWYKRSKVISYALEGDRSHEGISREAMRTALKKYFSITEPSRATNEAMTEVVDGNGHVDRWTTL